MEQKQPQQALMELSSAVAQLRLTRDEHAYLMQNVEIIKEALETKTDNNGGIINQRNEAKGE
jgi:hypothetical protein